MLDLLLDRAPHAAAAAQVFSLVERNELSGYLCATTATTVHYLATKVVGRKRSLEEIHKLLHLFEVAPVNRAVLGAALGAEGFGDFEDAVLHEAARHAGADALVTRNKKDFRKAVLPVYGPGELIGMLAAQRSSGRGVS